MTDSTQSAHFLDCTIRDGGYINRWQFSDDCVKHLVSTLDKCGYEFIEIGFRNNPEIYNNKPCGKWRYCTEQDIQTVVNSCPDRTIKIAVMADFANSSLKLFPPCKYTLIDMVRVAFHLPDLKKAMNFCYELKQKGYIVSANAMVTMNYPDEKLELLCQLANQYQLDYIYIADSYGCLIPKHVITLQQKIVKYLSPQTHVKIGLHAHNNIQNALANVLTLNNIDIIDSTVFGMGRGSGNLCTELIIDQYFESQKLLEICEFAEKYITPLYSTTPTAWGYNLSFIVSAHFRCHPNYILKLQDYNITTLKDIWYYIKKVTEAKKNKYFDIDYFNQIIAAQQH